MEFANYSSEFDHDSYCGKSAVGSHRLYDSRACWGPGSSSSACCSLSCFGRVSWVWTSDCSFNGRDCFKWGLPSLRVYRTDILATRPKFLCSDERGPAKIPGKVASMDIPWQPIRAGTKNSLLVPVNFCHGARDFLLVVRWEG